jgi:hypothetical protein
MQSCPVTQSFSTTQSTIVLRKTSSFTSRPVRERNGMANQFITLFSSCAVHRSHVTWSSRLIIPTIEWSPSTPRGRLDEVYKVHSLPEDPGNSYNRFLIFLFLSHQQVYWLRHPHTVYYSSASGEVRHLTLLYDR